MEVEQIIGITILTLIACLVVLIFFSKLDKNRIWVEIIERKNTAVGVVLASVITLLGILILCIVIVAFYI